MPRFPMIFPGQASQFVGMAQDLGQVSGAAAEWLVRIDEIVGRPLLQIMYEGPAETLTETRNAQPAILAHSVAVMLALREHDVAPSVVAGHSLGEYSAAVAAGSLTPEDGLRLVDRRGELMFAAGRERPGTMAAVLGLTAERVSEICAQIGASGGIVVVANHNSPAQIVISGETDAIEKAGSLLKADGARKVVPLNVSGAFHSPLLAEAAADFRSFLAEIELRDPQVPLIANVSAEPVITAVALREGLESQLTAPVLWQQTMERICSPADAPKPRAVLEVGPGRVLTNLSRRTYPDVVFSPVSGVDDVDRLPELLDSTLS